MLVAFLYMCLLLYANALIGSEGSNITWESQISMAKSNIQILLKHLLRILYTEVSEINISSNCQRSLIAFSTAIAQLKPWAVRMVDASAKIPSGLLQGTVMDFGSYDECLEIRNEKVSRNFTRRKEQFRGQYCTLAFQHSLLSTENKEEVPDILKDVFKDAGDYINELKFVFGICVPSACSKDDVQYLSSSVLKSFGIKSSVLECLKDEPFVWPYSSIAAVCILCILASLCFIGTLLDYLNRTEWKALNGKKEDDKNILWKILESFSILSNSEKLFRCSNDNDTIGCFHGIRVLTTIWIMYGHHYFLPDFFKIGIYRGILRFFNKFGDFSQGWLENFTLAVSTFFILSGFLLVKTTRKQLEKNNGILNLFKFLLHKYWRLTPAIGFTLTLFYALPVIDSGPLWNHVLNNYKKSCDGYWWAMVFYFHNWLSRDKVCLGHTWFVSTLMQLHILGFILLFVTYRWKYFGILTGILLSVACIAVTSCLAILWNMPLPIFSRMKDNETYINYLTIIYVKPYFNLTPYLVGMIVAYFSAKRLEKKINIKQQAIGWIFAVILAIFSIYAPYIPTKSKTFLVFYHMMHRTTWALFVGWFIYICASGCGGIVNSFLSSRPMQILGQLSYLMYLTHYLVIIYKFASARERIYFRDTEQVFSFISIFVISTLISFIGYVAVETPFMKIERLLFRQQERK